MQKITLLGDSIRLAYQPHVTQLLAHQAEVWGPTENGGHTPNLLVHLHLWALNKAPDILHLNAGLHDLKTIYHGGRTPIVPLHHYKENVRTLLQTIRDRTPAKIIWALTTPVDDASHNTAHLQWNDFSRYNEFVLAYNAAATEVCHQLHVPINDLYSIVQSNHPEKIRTKDGVHYNDTGSHLLAQAVVNSLKPFLTP